MPGLAVEMVELPTKATIRFMMGLYYGNTSEEISKDVKTMTDESEARFKAGTSGSAVYRNAKGMMEGLEKDAEDTVADYAREKSGDPFNQKNLFGPWAMGKVAKATVGLFTSFAKGVYAAADRTSTTGEQVAGALDIGLSLFGGSQVIFKPSMTPGLLKGLGEGYVLGGKSVLNWLRSPALPKSIKAFQYTLEMQAKQRAVAALAESNKLIMARAKELLKEGLKTWSAEAKGTAIQALKDMAKKQFEASMGGFVNALASVIGKSPTAIMDNIMGEMTDDYFKDLVQKAIDGPQYDGSYSGSISGAAGGSMKFTVAGKSVRGSISGSYKTDGFSGSMSGSLDEGSGAISCGLTGRIGDSKMNFPFTGKVTGRIQGTQGTGSWSARNQWGAPTGTWLAIRH